MSSGVVEQKPVLTGFRPPVESLFQFTDDVAQARNRALFRLQHIDPLDSIPKPALFLEIHSITLPIALNQHTEEAEEELRILLGGSEREWIDREVARVLAYVRGRTLRRSL